MKKARTAEEILAHQNKLARARRARWKAKNPDASKQYAARHGRALVKIKDAHFDEYRTIAATYKAEGIESNKAYLRARQELTRRHPDEWAAILKAEA